MHIIEGFLSPVWCVFWFVLSLPFVAYGIYYLHQPVCDKRDSLPLLPISAGFPFILASHKLPATVNGSTTPPTGTGLSVILFGLFLTSVIGLIFLLFQVILLLHSGLSSLILTSEDIIKRVERRVLAFGEGREITIPVYPMMEETKS